MKLIKRTAFAGEISDMHLNRDVALNGWVSKIRKLGEITFLDLRDRTEIVQVFFDKNIDEELFKNVQELKSEYVIGVSGKVRIRENENPEIKTGKYEVVGSELVIYSSSETPPIYVKDDDDVSEDLRLKYATLASTHASSHASSVLISPNGRTWVDESGPWTGTRANL